MSLLAVRVPYGGPIGEREIIDDIEDLEKEIFSQTFSAPDTLMKHGLRLTEIGECMLPPTVLLSFKTYSLRLVYRIKVVMEGHVSQERFRITALRDFCKVVCDVRLRATTATSSITGRISRLPSPRPAQIVSVDEERLPAYEQAPSYQDA